MLESLGHLVGLVVCVTGLNAMGIGLPLNVLSLGIGLPLKVLSATLLLLVLGCCFLLPFAFRSFQAEYNSILERLEREVTRDLSGRLKNQSLAELKEGARQLGIVPTGNKRLKQTYIAAIIEGRKENDVLIEGDEVIIGRKSQEACTAEVTHVNGDGTYDVLYSGEPQRVPPRDANTNQSYVPTIPTPPRREVGKLGRPIS